METKRKVQQLQDALDYSENIISTIREPLIVLDADLRIITANPAFYQKFSVTPQETQGKHIYELSKGIWNIPELRELLEEILPKNNSFDNFEISPELPGLGRRIMLLNACRIEDRGIKSKKVLLVMEDITDHQKLEHDIEASELRYRRLFETAQDGILIIGAKSGEIMDANPFLLKMLGYPKQDLLGKKLWELGFIRDKAASREAFQILQDKGYVRYEDLPLETKDGNPMDVEFVSNVYRIAGEQVIQCNIRNITERKQTEREISKLNENLVRRTNEAELVNQELEAFSYSVSHDLKAPLRSISGFSDVLLEDYSTNFDKQSKQYLQKIKDASVHMAKLIDDLLVLAKVTSIEINFGKVNLSELAKEVIGELQYADPDRKVKVEIVPNLMAYGDRNLLSIVLTNLLGNAWKFSSKVAKPRIELGITEQNGKPTYFIRDNGAGFDMEYADKLFKPFQRLHMASEFDGTGIGLSLVQRIIHRHGGRVWAEGKVGEGATLYFTLGQEGDVSK
jgi:PAS domain S-box-containing protein